MSVMVDIKVRTFEYSIRIVKLYRVIQASKDGAAMVIAKQFLRSGMSIGANVIEAYSAESKRDFVHKYGIALKEARESQYWLKLLAKSGPISSTKLTPLIKETDEIIAIITAIVKKTKANLNHAEP